MLTVVSTAQRLIRLGSPPLPTPPPVGRAEMPGGDPAVGTRDFALHPCIRLAPCWGRTMKQSFASAARLRGSGPILTNGSMTVFRLGSPPPRIVIGRPGKGGYPGVPKFYVLGLVIVGSDQAVGRSTTPCGTSPVVTMRQRAMSSLRASATIIFVLRAPLAPSVRDRNHCARALSFWNSKNRQASWIMPRRTRALPALARPFSRRLDPLSSG